MSAEGKGSSERAPEALVKASEARVMELAAAMARLVCVRDVPYVEDPEGRRLLDLAANEVGHLLALDEPEFSNLWREDDSLGRREPMTPRVPVSSGDPQEGHARVIREQLEHLGPYRAAAGLEALDALTSGYAALQDELSRVEAEREQRETAFQNCYRRMERAESALSRVEAERDQWKRSESVGWDQFHELLPEYEAQAAVIERLRTGLEKIAAEGTDFSPGYGGSWCSAIARRALDGVTPGQGQADSGDESEIRRESGESA